MANESIKNGIHTEYYENGQKSAEMNFNFGELEGKHTRFTF